MHIQLGHTKLISTGHTSHLVDPEGHIVAPLVQCDEHAVEQLLQLSHPEHIRGTFAVLEKRPSPRLAVEEEEGSAGGELWDKPKGQSLIPKLKNSRLQVLAEELTQCGSQALGSAVQFTGTELFDVHPKLVTIKEAGGVQALQTELSCTIPMLPGRQAFVIVAPPIRHDLVQRTGVPGIQGLKTACTTG